MKKYLKSIAMVMAMLFGLLCLAGCQTAAPVDAPAQEAPAKEEPAAEAPVNEEPVAEETAEPSSPVIQLTPVEAGTQDGAEDNAPWKVAITTKQELIDKWVPLLAWDESDKNETAKRFLMSEEPHIEDWWQINPDMPEILYYIPYNLDITSDDPLKRFKTNKEVVTEFPEDVIAEVLETAVNAIKFMYTADYRDKTVIEEAIFCEHPRTEEWSETAKSCMEFCEKTESIIEASLLTDNSLVYMDNEGHFHVRVLCMTNIVNDNRDAETILRESGMRKGIVNVGYHEVTIGTMKEVADIYGIKPWGKNRNFASYDWIDLHEKGNQIATERELMLWSKIQTNPQE